MSVFKRFNNEREFIVTQYFKQTAFMMVLLVNMVGMKQSNLFNEKWLLITEVSTSAFNWSK